MKAFTGLCALIMCMVMSELSGHDVPDKYLMVISMRHAIFGSSGRWSILRRELQGVATAFTDTFFSAAQSAFCIVAFIARCEYVYIDYMPNLDHGMLECIHWHVHYEHLMLRPDQA